MGEMTDKRERVLAVPLLLGHRAFPESCKLLAAALLGGTAGAASPAHHHLEGVLVSQPIVVLWICIRFSRAQAKSRLSWAAAFRGCVNILPPAISIYVSQLWRTFFFSKLQDCSKQSLSSRGKKGQEVKQEQDVHCKGCRLTPLSHQNS